MTNKKIAFFPYSSYGIGYINMVHEILAQDYELVNYDHVKKYGVRLSDIDFFYLNWLEDFFDDRDRRLLTDAKKSGKKIIWVFHNRLQHECSDEESALERLRFLAEISDCIIVHSHKSKDVLKDICKDSFDETFKKTCFIPHPNYIGEYRPYKYPHRNEVNLYRDDVFTFAFIGYIREYKNVEIILKAYDSIKNTLNCRLLLAGRVFPQEYYKKIEDQITGREDIILFPFHVGSLEMESFLNKSDVLILPYDLNSCMNSGSMLMAFSYHRTVIVSDICMAYDFPEELIYKYHYETDEDHVEKLKECMMQAYLSGSESLRDKGDRLYEIVRNRYDRDQVKKELTQLLESLEISGSDSIETDFDNFVENPERMMSALDGFKYRETILAKWVLIRDRQLSFAVFFRNNDLSRIIVYGYGIIGRLLVDELIREDDINVTAVIDQKASAIKADIPVITVSDDIPDHDILIVTFNDTNYVKNQIGSRSSNIIGIDELLGGYSEWMEEWMPW